MTTFGKLIDAFWYGIVCAMFLLAASLFCGCAVTSSIQRGYSQIAPYVPASPVTITTGSIKVLYVFEGGAWIRVTNPFKAQTNEVPQ